MDHDTFNDTLGREPDVAYRVSSETIDREVKHIRLIRFRRQPTQMDGSTLSGMPG